MFAIIRAMYFPTKQNLGPNTWKHFGVLFVFGLYILAVVPLFGQYSLLETILLSAGSAALLIYCRGKERLIAFIIAAVLGPFAEYLSVAHDIWEYKVPSPFILPLWLPLVWGYLVVLFRELAIFFDCKVLTFSGKKLKLTAHWMLGLLVLGYCIWTLSAIRREIALVYGVFVVIGLIFWRSKQDILTFWIGGILGTLGEYLCLRRGMWEYAFPYFKSIGLPISLLLAWGVMTVFVSRIGEFWAQNKKGETS